MEQHSGIGVVDKSVALMNAAATGPASLADLVARTGISRATAHRLAVALQQHRFLARDSQGRFIPGPALAELAATAQDPLVAGAPQVLRWLRDTAAESAQLYRRDGAERVCVAAAERATGLRTTVAVGARLPMTAGSAAQVLCAFDAADVSPSSQAGGPQAGRPQAGGPTLGAGGTAPFTARSLAAVRRRGWAQSVGQREPGVASVSAPVFGIAGTVIAAVSVSGPIDRLGRSPGLLLAPILISAADQLQALLRQ